MPIGYHKCLIKMGIRLGNNGKILGINNPDPFRSVLNPLTSGYFPFALSTQQYCYIVIIRLVFKSRQILETYFVYTRLRRFVCMSSTNYLQGRRTHHIKHPPTTASPDPYRQMGEIHPRDIVLWFIRGIFISYFNTMSEMCEFLLPH